MIVYDEIYCALVFYGGVNGYRFSLCADLKIFKAHLVGCWESYRVVVEYGAAFLTDEFKRIKSDYLVEFGVFRFAVYLIAYLNSFIGKWSIGIWISAL